MADAIIKTGNPLDAILGGSTAVVQLKSLIRQVAGSDITVLVTGESGTGKELVARAIHELSLRKRQPLVTINCGAIPEGIFESEIFGHEKGSFTSADQRRQGYFELADKGTLFLDEIGEMPLQAQVKLLRVLETGRFLRVGGMREIQVDVRLIAATNKDLADEVTRAKFRNDLFYRLKAVTLSVPPLRERLEDIPILANQFAADFASRQGRPSPQFDPAALSLLQRGYWSGNVRELKNLVESLVALTSERSISAESVRLRMGADSVSPNLPVIVSRTRGELDNELIYRTLLELRQELAGLKGMIQQISSRAVAEVQQPFADAQEAETQTLDDLEKDQIKKTLADFAGNRRLTAHSLGIGERTLYRKIKQFGLE